MRRLSVRAVALVLSNHDGWFDHDRMEGGRHLYVATGVGTSILPVRFLVPPAVTILNLKMTSAPSN